MAARYTAKQYALRNKKGTMQLSKKAEDALLRIKALRALPTDTQRAQNKIIQNLNLSDMADVALALQDEVK